MMLVSLFFLMFMQVAAQMRLVHGVVLDVNGDPIIGANVIVNGSEGRGTITDFNGEFQLQADPKEQLTVSFIGYVNQVVSASKTNLKIVLKEDSETLEEVVVVGYGVQKKATLTGAVASINNKEMTVTKNENVVNMLSGKIPGVRISQMSSAPGDFANVIDIRGMGEPLIVVDGIPRDKDYFSRMDANEIESVSVLKDASAAIYGVRAANGVILVTSKHGGGSDGKFDVTLSANLGWQTFLYMPETSPALEYMGLINEKRFNEFNANYPNRTAPIFSPDAFEDYRTGKKTSTNWSDEIFQKVSPMSQYNLSMNGGYEKIKYFFNIGYLKQEGQYKTGDLNYDRWNFRGNIDANITDRLKATVQLSGYMDEKNEPEKDMWTFYKFAWTYRPTAPAYVNGLPAIDPQFGEQSNPVASSNSDIVGYRKNKRFNFNGSFALNYDIPGVKGLSARAMYSYDYYTTDYTQYKRKYNLYSLDPSTGDVVATSFNPDTHIRRSTSPRYGTLMQLSLNYNNKFGAHGINAMLLFEESYESWDNFYAQRPLSVDGEYLIYGDEAGQLGGMTSYLGDKTRQALVGKLNYDYNGKYMADLSFRYDGSSRFPAKNRWGFFPSISVGWRMSEESFIKDNMPFISNLKLRASYGKMGDDAGANNYPQINVAYNIDADNVGYFFNNGYMVGVVPASVPNHNLSWYTAKTYNFGLDFDLWNQKLFGTFEVFKRQRDGLLATSITAIPGIIGASLPLENLNSDETFGWELSLGHRGKVSSVNYWVNGQISATKNRWNTFVQNPASNSMDEWFRADLSGRNKDIWFSYEEGGRFSNYDEIMYHPTTGANYGQGTLPGDYWYEDWNGDGVVNDLDRHPVATFNLPVFNYGLSMGLDWKGVDLSMNWQGAAGVYNKYDEVFTEVGPFGGQATLSRYTDRWHTVDPEADPWNPNTEWIEGKYPATGHSFNTGSTGIHNTSYLRLKTLEIGYTLPQKWTTKFGVKNLRLYFNGYNLLTFSGMDGMDPERPGHQGGANSGTSTGILFYNYPVNRTYNIGATIKF